MRLLSNSSSNVICYDAFIHEIPQVLSRILLDYVKKRGMWSIFDGCIDGSIQHGFFQWRMENITGSLSKNHFLKTAISIGLVLPMQRHITIS
jgi:hypothetical protein